MSIKNFNVKNGLTVGTATITAASGNLAVGNANLGNLAIANFFSGDGGLLSNLTIAAGTQIINGNSNVTVLANNVVYYNTSVVIPANSKIYVDQVTANAVTFTISGVEYA